MKRSEDEERVPVHLPVMVGEVVRAFQSFCGGIFVDATVGAGGHGAAILGEIDGIDRFVGIDRDADALREARRRLSGRGASVSLRQGDFRDLPRHVGEGNRGRIGGVLFDLGVSSLQLDRKERGFSYRLEGPLDMRMSQEGGKTASMVVNEYSEKALEDLFRRWGEERRAKRIARAIVRERSKGAIEDTLHLSRVVGGELPPRWRNKGLSRIYQALRIEVNDEMGALEEGLGHAVDFLSPGGRIAVLAYHSLEDRLVKDRFSEWARGCVCPPALPVCMCGRTPVLTLSPRRAIRPSHDEVLTNPRARSAKLRVAERLAADAQPRGAKGGSR